jgi:hypothetical protein
VSGGFSGLIGNTENILAHRWILTGMERVNC